jgi:hypothetical protein
MNARLSLLFALSGCGGLSAYGDLRGASDPPDPTGSADDTGQVEAGPNTPPVAHAGSDLLATAGQRVTLDGSLSGDDDGDTLGFTWSMPTHPPEWGGPILDAYTTRAEFYPNVAGIYEATLAVDDGEFTATDTVRITVEEPNGIPLADAGSDVYAEVGDRVFLDGSRSSDPEGDAIDYRWRLLDLPLDSTAALSSATVPRPDVVVDVAGVYVVELTVQDAAGNLSYPDEMRIVVESGATPSDPGGGRGGLLGCLGCAGQQLGAGDAAAAPFLLVLPLLLVLQRRRDP